MVKVAIVKKDTTPLRNATLRLGVAALGILIASASLSIVTGVSIATTVSTIARVFADPAILRYLIVFLPIGLGLAIAYSARLWNLGAEGQLVVGAIAATYVALFTPLGRIPFLGPATSLLAAAAAGMLWVSIPAFLRIRLGVNEALTTLMMNYIAYYLADYLVTGPWKGRKVYGYPETDLIPDTCVFPWLYGYSFSIYPLLIAILLVLAVYYLLYRTRIGTAIRALGASPTAVELSGVSSRKMAFIAFILSGALAGLVGGNEILMYHRKLVPGAKVGANMGFVSILVAWFADLNPLAMPLSAYYVSALYYLRVVIQVGEISEYVARMFVGLVFLLVLVSIFMSRYRLVIRR